MGLSCKVILAFVATILLAGHAVYGFDCFGMAAVEEIKSMTRLAEGLGQSIFLKSEPNYRELVKFYLYTRETGQHPVQLFVDDFDALRNSPFDGGRPTKIVIHGYINSVASASVQKIKDAFIELGSFNVIGVDWGLITHTAFYNVAAEQTEPVGHYVGQFIRFLLDHGVHPGDIHLLGHSLGAHVAGFAGSSLNGTKVERISGLDPAKPCFHNSPPDLRLDPSDAHFVDCIHTCGGYLGLMENVCHADFYPNGGVDTQPGCLEVTMGICSHERSFHYYAESILPGHGFSTFECTEIPSGNLDSCYESSNLMGYQASPVMPGIFYSTTRESFPYSYNVTSYV